MSLPAVHRRARRIGLMATLMLAGLGFRATWLAGPQHAAHLERSLDNALRSRTIDAPRGRVLDRAGRPLADARPAVDLVLRPVDVEDEEVALLVLLDALGEEAVTRARHALSSTGLHRSRRHVVARDLDETTLARVSARLSSLAGFDLRAAQQRTYPFGNTAAHLLGFLGEVTAEDLLKRDPERYRAGDLLGRQGIEARYEPVLAGAAGLALTAVDARGRPVQGTGPWRDRLQDAIALQRRTATAGGDLYLTLDLDVQRAAEDALTDYTGSAVMLDVHTGAVLAYATTPRFDPNELARGIDGNRWVELGQSGSLVDRASRGLYPPASTFKIVTAAAALEAGISKDHRETCSGGTTVGGRTFHCWKRGGHGSLDLVGALEHSCDIWFYRAGLRVGPEALGDMARRLGLGAPTGFGLNGERAGLVPDPEWLEKRQERPWSGGDTANASIGQGTNLVTPLQLAVMTATVANGGQRVVPWVVDRAVSVEGATLHVGGPAPATNAKLSMEVLDGLRRGMEAVVSTGTAKRSQVDGLPMAGKTGTAQTVSRATRLAHPGPENEDHALFIAFAPVDHPKVAVAVVLEHAGGGSAHAAPVAQQMMEAWGRAEGWLPETPEDGVADGGSVP